MDHQIYKAAQKIYYISLKTSFFWSRENEYKNVPEKWWVVLSEEPFFRNWVMSNASLIFTRLNFNTTVINIIFKYVFMKKSDWFSETESFLDSLNLIEDSYGCNLDFYLDFKTSLRKKARLL